jgi:fatty acid desaturase
MPLRAAIVGTQIIAVLICGFGWFVTALPWTVIGLTWLCLLSWMVVLDGVKLALYSRLQTGVVRPHWYERFLKARSASRTASQVAAWTGRN